MAETKCKKCHSFVIWIEVSAGWRLFDYGKKQATPEEPLISSKGEEITKGLGFQWHHKTCGQRIRKKLAQARKDKQDREERRRKHRERVARTSQS